MFFWNLFKKKKRKSIESIRVPQSPVSTFCSHLITLFRNSYHLYRSVQRGITLPKGGSRGKLLPLARYTGKKKHVVDGQKWNDPGFSLLPLMCVLGQFMHLIIVYQTTNINVNSSAPSFSTRSFIPQPPLHTPMLSTHCIV